jgi:PAS domain S-box-containing protein
MYRILYVDDEPGLLEITKLYLEDDGAFTVDTSPSPVDALHRLQSVPYDAIISDYQMLPMDGITFLKTLRSGGSTTPFIIFTGKGREDVVIEALNSGADFYLQKGGEPIAQFAELAHKLHHAISRKRADLALERSERDYRNLVEHANEAICVAQDGVLRMVNPRSVELSGYADYELLDKPFTRIIHPDERETITDRFRRRIGGEPVTSRNTYRLYRKDQTTRWIDLSAVTITWDGRPATLNFITDVTDRKQAEDALRESEERYRHIFESFEDLYYQTDMTGIATIISPSVDRLLGWSTEELLGTPVTKLYVNPEDRKDLLDAIAKTGKVRDYEVALIKRDGSHIPVSLSASRIYHSDGTPAGIAGIIRDISRRKHDETALRESEEKFRSLVDYALEAILILDLQGTLLFANNAAIRMIELDDGAQLAGRNVMEFIAPESRNDVIKDFEQVARGRDAYLARYNLITTKGNRISVESTGKVITYEGKPADFISLRDITGLRTG